ncbi:MAG: hypothetical protein NC307_09595 [Roseburia sp.]|nr:hypothetical protein [Roseburia sp.]
MIKKIREEDDADKWLREHDPYYLDKRRNKKNMEYYYETPLQERRKGEKEIPFSSLSTKHRKDVFDAGGDIL